LGNAGSCTPVVGAGYRPWPALVLVFFLPRERSASPLQAAVDLLPPGNAALDFAGLLVAGAAALGCYALAVQVGEGR